jgi:hypothetical protein
MRTDGHVRALAHDYSMAADLVQITRERGNRLPYRLNVGVRRSEQRVDGWMSGGEARREQIPGGGDRRGEVSGVV